MCGRINQHMFEKLHYTAIEHIKKYSMGDCSRKADDFDLANYKDKGGVEKK